MYLPKSPQAIFSLFGAFIASWNTDDHSGHSTHVDLNPIHAAAPTKSIAIVGAGSAGLAAVKALVDLPEDVRQDWEIVAYDERRDFGGIWLPDSHPYTPPTIPETPLYPRLHTNTPVPSMTYPHFPFPPLTPLYPSHEHVQQYHATYARELGLDTYVHFNHTVVSAAWVGQSDAEGEGWWDVLVRVQDEGSAPFPNDQRLEKPYEFRKRFDHLILATGNFHVPRIPHFAGQDDWLAASTDPTRPRTIMHSMWYRHPEDYANRTVLVVGAGASASDVGSQVLLYANEVYQSIRASPSSPSANTSNPLPPPVILKPAISHFNASSIVFVDGSAVHDAIDTVILGTGYEVRVPILERTGEVLFGRGSESGAGSGERDIDNEGNNEDDVGEDDPESLTTNGRYIHPLHEHIFSLASHHPPTALAFIGLPSLVANCFSDTAQGRYVATAIASEWNNSLVREGRRPRSPVPFLPSREEMLASLAEREERVRERGLDPYTLGHRMLDREDAFTYQDALMDRVYSYYHNHHHHHQHHNSDPTNAHPPHAPQEHEHEHEHRPFTEPWRRALQSYTHLKRGWARVEGLGEEEVRRWLEGVEGEEGWARLMARLEKWEERIEREEEEEREGGNLKSGSAEGGGGELD